MPEQPDQTDQPDSQSQGKSAQGLVPLLASAAAAAAAGAVTAAVRRRRAAGGDEGGGEEDERDEARLDDVERVADELGGLVDALRSEFRGSGDYERLTEIADTISEFADEAADAFSRGASGGDDDVESRIGDELLQRVRELRGGGGEQAGDEAGEAQQEAPA